MTNKEQARKEMVVILVVAILTTSTVFLFDSWGLTSEWHQSGLTALIFGVFWTEKIIRFFK